MPALFFPEISTFREWVHYRYGTFSEVGFDSDSLYPSQYQFGPLEKQSQGCGNLTWSNAGEDFEQMVDASIDLKVSQFLILYRFSKMIPKLSPDWLVWTEINAPLIEDCWTHTSLDLMTMKPETEHK